MLFTSILFISIFLPLFLILYYSFEKRGNAIALFFSLVFYFWGAPKFLPVVLIVGALNYFLSARIAKTADAGVRKWLVGSGVVLHVGILIYYKYLMFFAGQLLPFMQNLDPAFEIPKIILPLGISFITFEQISYLMDVYRGDCRPTRKLSDYYLFLLFFPHSIAGPIFRWRDLEKQIESRTLRPREMEEGFLRFIYGLAKKVLIANFVAFPADQMFGLPSGEVGFTTAWIGAIAYTLQIYFDFSAYSDMAIGIGKMVGFNFKENFQFPYLSRSVTEFWERWHISLTSWFRSYLYIPLGGNRVSPLRTYLNILIVFAVSGFWHGASWNFLVWGVYFGVLIVAERRLKLGTHAPGISPVLSWRILPTLLLAIIGWVFFRAHDLTQAVHFLKAMTGALGNPAIVSKPWALLLPYRSLTMMAAACVWFVLEPRIYLKLMAPEYRRWQWAAALPAFVLALASLANSSYNPFIYFRF